MPQEFSNLLKLSSKIVVIIANNPDADSVGSALALRQILSSLDKQVALYCRTEVPFYLRFLTGWEDIQANLPQDYDLAIMVDNSALTLIQSDKDPDFIHKLKVKPLIILDHHQSPSTIDFAQVIINQPEMASTGQVIYTITQDLNWPINQLAATFLAASILSDSMGFTSQIMINNAQPLRVVADLVDLGVDLADLAQRRLSWQEIPSDFVTYKGQLLQAIEFYAQNQIAVLDVDYAQIKRYGAIYNPTIILDEMKFVQNVKISLGFKQYENKFKQLMRITLRIRCHRGCQLAKTLAETFGGGGHPFAAGVKWEEDGLDFLTIKAQVLEKAQELLETSK